MTAAYTERLSAIHEATAATGDLKRDRWRNPKTGQKTGQKPGTILARLFSGPIGKYNNRANHHDRAITGQNRAGGPTLASQEGGPQAPSFLAAQRLRFGANRTTRASRYQGNGPDEALLVCEVKARASVEGFVQLERWLGEADVLCLRCNNAEPM